MRFIDWIGLASIVAGGATLGAGIHGAWLCELACFPPLVAPVLLLIGVLLIAFVFCWLIWIVP